MSAASKPEISGESGTTGLRRQVSLPAATALVAGGVIGVGIFLTPAEMARTLASPALLLAVWVFLGATAFCGALCFGELATRFPAAGGGYVYLREAFGPVVAFLYGWKCLMVLDPGLNAALAAGLGAYVQALAPAVPAKAVALVAVAAVAAANLAGVRMATGIGQALAVVKVGLLVLLVIWGFLSGAGDASHLSLSAPRLAGAPALVPALAGALISGFFSFGGWWEVAKLGGEVKDPQRTLPRALALGVAIVTLLYIAVSAVFLYLVPLADVGSSEAFAAQAGTVLFGATGGRWLTGLVALCILGSLFAFMTMAPRVYYAMSQDGLMPAFVARVHPRTGAPVAAVLIQAALTALLVVLGTFDTIVAYFIFATVAFLGAMVVGLFVLRRRSPQDPASGGFATPLFPLPALGFLLCVVVVLGLLAVGRPVQVALGMGVVLLGLPIYLVLFRRRRA